MNKRIIGVLGVVIGAVFVAGCGWSQTPVFDPKRIERMQVDSARQEPPHEMPAMPRALEPSSNEKHEPATLPYLQATTRPYGREVPMTLQEVIHRTVMNSLEVRVAGFQPAIDEARILEAESRFDPLVFAEGQLQRQYPQGIGGGSLDPLKVL